ncbi:hypothetical protein PR202_ga00412 [Eleusine coracana subsp. coracana]|uniref:RNase H type-1 domain-containing protein n=1 Tax=Eleusine coracana subsp. coracana TaxID=191504 RepID=A0AAV5BGF8_ELECO|nr:hypothetical protein PR202_ga00412 [Eleusine coracana subsp. coracana]
MEEGSNYYLVRKGDMVAVYRTLNDCQAQICSSVVTGPAASAYKGYSWSREKEGYFSSHGLSNAAYVINAAELTEDILGPLEPCSFEDIIRSSSNQPTPNHTGSRDGIRDQTGSQSVDLNHMVGILHFDGASKGNPGKAGAGAVLMTEDGRVVYFILNISRLREGLGIATNNVAEYRGLILGLRYSIRHGFKRIKVHGDSQLVCNQVCLFFVIISNQQPQFLIINHAAKGNWQVQVVKKQPKSKVVHFFFFSY